MDHKLALKYQALVKQIEADFGEEIDTEAIMVLIGIQELGQGYAKYSKDEKINLIHIATCTILEPYGYYEFTENDEDGWPHFEKKENLPPLDSRQQEHLIKEAILAYFRENEYYVEEEVS
jgi:hypothetical protein